MVFFWRVAHNTINGIVKKTSEIIHRILNSIHVVTPSTAGEWQEEAKEFGDIWQLAMCCGALDGKRVSILMPSNFGNVYYNYKNFFSIVLMACVDLVYLTLLLSTKRFH